MQKIQEYYFKNDIEWRDWLHKNHTQEEGIHLIFYKVDHDKDSMRWEEAVQVALCYGWIDSTVKTMLHRAEVLPGRGGHNPHRDGARARFPAGPRLALLPRAPLTDSHPAEGRSGLTSPKHETA